VNRGVIPETPVVLVQFDQGIYTGPSCLVDRPGVVPIVAATQSVRIGTRTFVRHQLPLRLGYACTIHKSQGATCDRLVLSLMDSSFARGLAYVALSRVRRLCHILIADNNFSLRTLNGAIGIANDQAAVNVELGRLNTLDGRRN